MEYNTQFVAKTQVLWYISSLTTNFLGVLFMIKFWDIQIPPLTGKEKRKVYVYVPDSYEDDPGLRYPVLYMFDGHNVFFDTHATYGKSWGMKEYLDNNEVQLMVVAVECNHSPDHGRLKEYSPYDFSDDIYGHIKGKGDITLDWYIKTLKPYIDANYPTLPDREFTYIGGSSMGGLMSLYAVFARNDVFSGAMSMSPSIWVAPRKLKELIKNTEVDHVTDLYIDFGEYETSAYYDKLSLFFDIVNTAYRKGVCVNSRMVPEGSHCEASWEKQLPFAIQTLMYRADRLEEELAREARENQIKYDLPEEDAV